MAFHNVPPNGFPDIPDIEDLEAVEKDVKTLKTTTSEQGAAITALGTNKAPKTDIAAAFSAESNYEVGDLVYYEGALYECTTAHEAAAWSAEDFTAASVGSTISVVNSNLTSNIVEYKTDVEAPVRVNLFNKDSLDKANKYYDGTEWHNVSSDGWITVFIPVIGGVTYTASGFPAQGGVKTVFTTGDKTTVLSDFSASENNSTRTAPNNAKYIGFGIYSPNADYTSAQFEIGSTSTAYTPYIPSVETRLETIESAVQTKTSIASASIDGSNAVEINVANLTSYDFVVCGVSYYDTGIANYGFVMIPVTEFLLFSDSGTKIFFSKTGGGVSFVDVKSDNNRTKLTFTPESGVTPTGRYYFVHGIKTR